MCNQFIKGTAGPEQDISTRKDTKYCKLSCCNRCTFCSRALPKERVKSRDSRLSNIRVSQIKVCETCFLCHSVVLCPICKQCPKCCTKSACRSQAPKLLGNLVKTRGRSKDPSNTERRLYPPLSDTTKSYKVPNERKWLRQSPQEQLPVGGIASAYGQKRSRVGPQSNIIGLLQPTVSSSQTQQQMEADTRSEQTKPFPQGGKIQNGNTGNHQNISPAGRVGHLSRLQGCLLPHTNTGTIQEISQISYPGPDLPVQSSSLWPVHSPHGVHCNSQRGETDGRTSGYKDPPVPRRLVGESQIQTRLPPPYSDASQNLPGPRLAGEFGKIRAGTQTSLRLCRLPIRPQVRTGQTDSGPVAKPSGQNTSIALATDLSGPTVHVTNRTPNGHRKASSPRPLTYETHTVASQKSLESTRVTRKDHSTTQIFTPSPAVVAGGRQCPTRSTPTPNETCSANFYRRIKRRVGCSLKRAHCKRLLVSSRKPTTHKLPGTQGSLSSLKRIPRSLCKPDSPSGYGQHHSRSIHKQGRRHEVGPSVCPPVENLDLVFPETSNSKSPSYSGQAKCDSRQAIQTGSDHPDGVVPYSGGISEPVQEVAPASNRPLRHQVQLQTTSVCVSNSGPTSGGSGCSHPALGGSGCLCLSTDRHLGQSSRKATGHPMQKINSDRSGVAQHALVLGLSGHVQSSPPEPTSSAQPVDTALQPDPSQESDQPKSPRLAPRATAIKEQGFSEAVAARIEAPQRRSTRSVYEAKWTIFTKWCIANQVDFRSPPVNSVADFLLYLFEVKNLQPSTIDGYRSAIADKLGNATVNISKDDNLTRLLDSFHRDRPKGRRGIPSWNLSLVLHQLTKAPFEPLREASLKHLTFKTVFLLALGSGKRRSEIHAWQHKNIRHQSDWSKVSLIPSPSFLSKNQLAKEGPESVAPVVIPALAPTLDRSLKSDRSLCPVRALRYYLDRTSDLRQHKELVFVSFKKGFDKDISPATISSWIKQTVILCYELSDQQAHTLHQVKAHDVRAFAASKAFQSGVSLEQILSACHWKSHNTFTQFYLKDVAWADSELYHLGPVVAAQQIHQQPRT